MLCKLLFIFAYSVTTSRTRHILKRSISTVACLAVSAFLLARPIDQVVLTSGWKFHTGDDLEWKSPSYDDGDWENVLPFGYWDYLHDHDHDGYAWYRIRFYLPSGMKKGLSGMDSLYVYLGRIDDNDETYLNGRVIGQNTRNVTPATAGEFANIQFMYDQYRTYSLPVSSDIIKWDTINTLAVRVYDIWLTGGLYTLRPRVYVKRCWEGKLEVVRKSEPPALLRLGEQAGVSFLIRNRHPDLELNALFITDILTGEAEQPEFTNMRELQIPPGEDAEVEFSFPVLVEDYKHVYYKIIEKTTNLSFGQKSFYGLPGKDIRLLDKPVTPVVGDKVPAPYQPIISRGMHIGGYLGSKMDLNTEKGLAVFPEQFVEPYFTGEEPRWPVGEVAKALHGGTKMLLYGENQILFEVIQAVNLIWIDKQAEDGYIGTYKPVNRWMEWDVWDHKYVMLGLLQFYSITGYKPALKAAGKIGDLMCETFGYGEGQLDLMANGPHQGMASGSILEPMVYLYKYTGKEKYLDFSRYISTAFEQENGPRIVSELTNGSGTVLKVGTAKGYEMMSCLIGLIQLYKVTGEGKLLQAAINAWDDIAGNRLYITGTATESEHFQETGQLNAGKEDSMGEGCVTAHWMYLSKELFKLTGEQKYLDEIDKSLYNHLLAAQHPVSGNIVYYTPLQGDKYYLPFDLNIGPPPCCHFSVKRCISEIPEFSFYEYGDEIGINLYNPASFETKVPEANGLVDVRIEIKSDFPQGNQAEISVEPGHSTSFTLSLRVPAWAAGFSARAGQDSYMGKPGAYLKIKRKWNEGDRISITMDFPVRVLEGGQSYPGHHAIKYGPQVLAVDSHVNRMTSLDSVIFDPTVEADIRTFPAKMPDGWVGRQSYISNSVRTRDGKEVILVPFSDASQTGGEMIVWIKDREK